LLPNAIGGALTAAENRERSLVHRCDLGGRETREGKRERGSDREDAHVGNMIPAPLGSVHASGAGVRKMRSLTRCRMRSYIARPLAAVASVGRPIEPALSLGTRKWPRR